MSRYIDQDKVIDAVLELDTTHRVSWRDAVIDMIDAMAPEDVQPVVHGEWIDGVKRQTCSICCYRGVRSWTYCPSCGAKMDKQKGEDNEND